MYCIKCGVKLLGSEKKCPLCDTTVCHPDFENIARSNLYPDNKMPKEVSNSKTKNGVIIILFMIPLIICFLTDIRINGSIDWFGYVAGALSVAYIMFAFPLWFEKRNPIIFTLCSFASVILYLLYINLATDGGWFMSFAFPVAGGLSLIICTVVALLHYLKKGRLYIIGGALVVLGAFMMLIEFFLNITFDLRYMWWSIYPLTGLALLGGLLIFLGINRTARELMERKLFF